MKATVIETLNGRNRDFASHRHVSSLEMMPSMKSLIIGCVDPRRPEKQRSFATSVGASHPRRWTRWRCFARSPGRRAAIWPPAGTSWSCTIARHSAG